MDEGREGVRKERARRVLQTHIQGYTHQPSAVAVVAVQSDSSAVSDTAENAVDMKKQNTQLSLPKCPVCMVILYN